MRRLVEELLVAFQFLTRLPVPRIGFQPDSLSRSAKLFPVVGLVIGLGTSLLQHILTPHLNHTLWRRLESGAGSHDPAGQPNRKLRNTRSRTFFVG